MGGKRAAGKARQACHYCREAPATTRDHIVPRSRVRSANVGTVSNIVKACGPCNTYKDNKRSDCLCPACLLAWETYGPPGWRTWEVRGVIRRASSLLAPEASAG